MNDSREIILALDVKSSYKEHNIGLTIYDYVMKTKPKKIIEFGVLNGYSAICFGLALRDLGLGGKAFCYDLWEKYPYNHGDINEVQKTIDQLGLTQFVELDYGDAYEWAKAPDNFDLLHIDVSNDGQRLRQVLDGLKAAKVCNGNIMFEGGTIERDAKGWKSNADNIPISKMKGVIGYRVLDERFPGLSLIEKNKEQVKVFMVEYHKTPTGYMTPVYKHWNSPIPDYEPKMLYHSVLDPQAFIGPMLHRRKAGIISCVEGHVDVEYTVGKEIKKAVLCNSKEGIRNAIYVPGGTAVKFINKSKTNKAQLTNIPDRAWYPEDPDSTKWETWYDFWTKEFDL